MLDKEVFPNFLSSLHIASDRTDNEIIKKEKNGFNMNLSLVPGEHRHDCLQKIDSNLKFGIHS